MNFFLEQFQISLHALNGYEGEPEDYRYWALLVTNATSPDLEIFPPQDLIDAKTIFDSKVSNINIGC